VLKVRDRKKRISKDREREEKMDHGELKIKEKRGRKNQRMKEIQRERKINNPGKEIP
jgi:hypothetical protein